MSFLRSLSSRSRCYISGNGFARNHGRRNSNGGYCFQPSSGRRGSYLRQSDHQHQNGTHGRYRYGSAFA